MMTIKSKSGSRWNTIDEQAGGTTRAATTASGSATQPGESQEQRSASLDERMEPRDRKDFLDLTRLIRSIQAAEGNLDCFRRKDDCEWLDCAWRRYCLDGSKPQG
jgi:hypothetical protein